MDETNVLEKRNKIKKVSAIENYTKVKEVIKSCINEDQLRVAVKLYNLLNKKHIGEIPQLHLDTLENLIGLMRIKCKGDEEVNEVSSSGKEFRKAAGLSGVPELQKLVFDEDEEKGGVGDDMDASSIAKKYDFPIEDIKKEIYIGSKIEKEHTDNEELAAEFATDHIVKFIEEVGEYDYYTDPQYGIIAVEDRMGENKKTIRISKKEMDKLHKKGNVSIDGVDLTYKEEISEELNMNDITQSLRDQLKRKHDKRFTKSDIFDKIRQLKHDEQERRRNQGEIIDREEEIEEATGASSAGAFEPALDTPVYRRNFYDIPVTKDGMVGKEKMGSPIGKLYSMKGKTTDESEILEEEGEIDEATSYADAVGAYDTPGFAPSEFMGTAGKKGKGRVNKGITHSKLTYPGGEFVKIKNKCARFPYCNQSPNAIKLSKKPFKDAFYENKIVKKRNLKIKK